MIDLIFQFIVSMITTMAFALIFSAPRSELLFCGMSGAIGWIIYLTVSTCLDAPTLGNVLGALALTLFSRILAVTRKKPGTVYLISGIFPLVPGAGIYYTSYNLISNDLEQFSSYGILTLKTAGAIVIGIILGMALPQSILNRFFAPSYHK